MTLISKANPPISETFQKLSDVFQATAIKILSSVDACNNSNQHEIGGLVKAGLGRYLGLNPDHPGIEFPTQYVWVDDELDEPLRFSGTATWYNARRTSPSKRSPEYRLYYVSNVVTDQFRPGTILLICVTKKSELLMLAMPPDSRAAEQIQALFVLNTNILEEGDLKQVDLLKQRFELPLQYIFSQIYGVSLADRDEDREARVQEVFGDVFPSTDKFSHFVQNENIARIDPIDDPDGTLITLMTEEELWFRALETTVFRKSLIDAFDPRSEIVFASLDRTQIDKLQAVVRSAQNRRMSRAGSAFEHHIAFILDKNHIRFKAQAVTERSKPDFIFPGQQEYDDPLFPVADLRLLGAKTTCKDRWRQVLKEGVRIPVKHLITMEPSISERQTTEMYESGIRLIVPSQVHPTYKETQLKTILSFADFIREISLLQKSADFSVA